MILQILGIDAGYVRFDDGSGPNEVDTADVHKLAEADTDLVFIDGRQVATQTLLALRSFITELEMPPCSNCGDAPGTEDMGDDVRFCPACRSGAAGSRFDDRGTGI